MSKIFDIRETTDSIGRKALVDAVYARRSVRTFDGLPVPREVSGELLAALDARSCPFGTDFDVHVRETGQGGHESPGTYGVISGARNYVLIGTRRGSRESLLAAGFCGESLVLTATSSGLGTCWLGGTFRRGDFDRRIKWKDGYQLKLLIAYGHPANRRRLVERIESMVFASRRRKAFATLFFDGEFGRPLSENSPYSAALNLMRLAPSSVNSQPWRAVVSEGNVHFYAKVRDDLSYVDMGIGLCNFDIGVNNARYFKAEQVPQISGLEYVISCVRDNRISENGK